MSSKNEGRVLKSKLYVIIFTTGLCILAVMPIFFYWSKVTKNPAEFKQQEKNFLTIVARIKDIPPEVMERIKVGDIQRDYNGEENARVVSILKVEPQVTGKVALNNNAYVNILSEKKDLYLVLRLRYNSVGGELLLHPTAIKLKIGNVMTFESPDYCMNAEIIKIEAPKL